MQELGPSLDAASRERCSSVVPHRRHLSAPTTVTRAVHVREISEASVAVHTTGCLTPGARVAVSGQSMVGGPLASVAMAPMGWLVPSSTTMTEVGHVITGGVLSAHQGPVNEPSTATLNSSMPAAALSRESRCRYLKKACGVEAHLQP